jgi:hypothetical protein
MRPVERFDPEGLKDLKGSGGGMRHDSVQKEMQTMSTQKRLSHLSFAAAALLAAALPCFAQAESNQTRNQAGNLNAAEATQIAVLGTERVSVNKAETRKAADAKVSEKRPTLSAEQFRQAAKGSASANAFLATQIFAAPKDLKSSNNDETASRKITFVPSKGQKLPSSVNSQ